MFAKLLADSGGADEIVDTIVGTASPRTLPWAMALVGAIIGLPMFFEIGLVLLMPVIYLVARRSQVVADHRRHPGAGRPFRDARARAAAPGAADRDRSARRRPRHHAGARRGWSRSRRSSSPVRCSASSPVAGSIVRRHRRRPSADADGGAGTGGPGGAPARQTVTRARRSASRCSRVLLPVVLMMGKALVDIFIDDENQPAAPDLRHPRHAADRAADRGHRRHVHPRPRRRHDPRSDRRSASSPRCRRSPASS